MNWISLKVEKTCAIQLTRSALRMFWKADPALILLLLLSSVSFFIAKMQLRKDKQYGAWLRFEKSTLVGRVAERSEPPESS